MTTALPLLPIEVSTAFVTGLLVGSFLNVVVYRVPLGLSISAPRSFCPSCRRQLAWWENIPVVSWLWLRGRCRTCQTPISARYPLVELSTGTCFALVAGAFHGGVLAIPYCMLVATALSVSLIEFDDTRAPLGISMVGTSLSLAIVTACAGWQRHWPIVFGSLIGTVIAGIIYSVARWADAECKVRAGFGRSALMVAGCWLGALRAFPLVVGSCAIAVTFASALAANAMVGSRNSRLTSNEDEDPEPIGSTDRPAVLVAVPLVLSLLVGMGISLITSA
jgi:leader peptidase (prepilin peptidase) / N-methyltransferase